MTMQQHIARLVGTLKRERDELKVQVHLLKADAHDEWVKLEKQWIQFERKAETVGTTAGQAAGEVGAAVRILGEEVRAGYRRIRDSLKSK